MNEIARWTTMERRLPPGRGPAGRNLGSGILGALGGLVMTVALAAAAAVALVFAATLAIVMLLATVMLGLATVAWRMRPRSSSQRAPALAPSGHGWVAYGWERR